jgi:hypothetical protein
MSVRWKHTSLFASIFIVHVLFSYNWWWQSSVGTLLILALSWALWQQNFLERVGISFLSSKRLLFVTAILLALVALASCYLCLSIAQELQVEIFWSSWHSYFHGAFYTLNEEIVLGAILVLTATKIIPLPLPWISLLLAVIFALIHLAFYQWIFLDRGTLQISTLITLLMIGFLRNNLIMYCRHIGYVWAIHFGWIAVMLDSVHRYGKTGQHLSELEQFNLYLGSPTMLTISTLLALLSLFLLLGQDRHHGMMPRGGVGDR